MTGLQAPETFSRNFLFEFFYLNFSVIYFTKLGSKLGNGLVLS